MLHDIWATIGIIVGWIILIPLSIFFAALIGGCMKEIINITIAAANVIQAWVDEKLNNLLHKK